MKYIIERLTIALVIIIIGIPLYLFPIKCNAQSDLPYVDGKVVYEHIDSSITASKADLFKRSGEWFANTFKSANNVIQYSDQESGKIIAKGIYSFEEKKGGSIGDITCRFTIEVVCKENKYRARIYDLLLTNSSSSFKDKPIESVKKENVERGMMKKYFSDTVSKCDARMQQLLKELGIKLSSKKQDDF